MTGARIAVPLGLAVALAIAGLTLAPRGFEAESLLAAQDDPVALADRAVARSFDAAVAAREIDAALAANDADLAQQLPRARPRPQRAGRSRACRESRSWPMPPPRPPRARSRASRAA